MGCNGHFYKCLIRLLLGCYIGVTKTSLGQFGISPQIAGIEYNYDKSCRDLRITLLQALGMSLQARKIALREPGGRDKIMLS